MRDLAEFECADCRSRQWRCREYHNHCRVRMRLDEFVAAAVGESHSHRRLGHQRGQLHD
jgi:hypothetical protein